MSNFQKQRDLDKLNHTLKYGVTTGAISGTFGLAKPEIQERELKLLSDVQMNQMKWRQNCESLVRLTGRFFGSMKQLQKSVHASKRGVDDGVRRKKMEFETHKKDIESALADVKAQLEASQLDIITKAGSISPGKSRTEVNLEKAKNIAKFMAGKEDTGDASGVQVASHTISQMTEVNEGGSLLGSTMGGDQSLRKSAENRRLVPAPNIQHYKPQELIRLEGEAN